ncbi:MAG: bifunctional metallophosphatase/5'-nucleotidase [Candidatus Thermoplasmatota archaeon]
MVEKEKITLLQLNDSHAYFEPHPEYYWEDGEEIYREAGGYARISAYLKKVRKENPEGVIALDNGDTIHGTFPAVKNQGKDMIPILNEMDFDAWTAHWEFAYGPDNLMEITEKLDYPMLAINCYYEESDDLVYEPYKVIEKKGVKFGIIGIAATIVDKTMPDFFSEGIYFTLGNEELPGYIEELKEEKEVDIIVVLSHLGYPQELKLAREIDGIDILLSGHTHNRIYEPVKVNDTVVIQSGCHGSFVGRLDLGIKNREVKETEHELVWMDDSIERDSKVEEIVNETLSSYRDMLDKVVGKTETALTRNRVMESTMDNLLLKSMLNETDAEMAFSNGWRYGAPIPPGPIKINDLWKIVPVDPPVSVCDITGKELKEMLEEDMEGTFASDPYDQKGGYLKRCKGIYVYFKVENPSGHRIQEFYIGDEKVKKDKTYRAAFITSQGIPEKYGTDRKDLDIRAIEAMKNYIRENSPLSVELEGNMVPI